MKVCILGCGKSGIAAFNLAKSLGQEVFLSEFKSIDNFNVHQDFINKNINEIEFGGHSNKVLENTNLIITSPGIPPISPIIIEAEKKGVEIISELEFAYRVGVEKFGENFSNNIVAITGTNGKTTTTSLIYHIFKKANLDVYSCGNIGTPLSEVLLYSKKESKYIIEVSSYQLDRIKYFHSNVSIILNITPDHLSYHGSLESYIHAKWKISLNQIKNNLLVLNYDDSTIVESLNNLSSSDIGGDLNLSDSKATISFISIKNNVIGASCSDEKIYFIDKQQNKEELMSVSQLSLPGVHNIYNSMAAALAARHFEIRNEDIRDALSNFTGVEHRLELVKNIRGIDFINDSKATNINATWFALTSYKKPIIWIAGGMGDNNDYSPLDTPVHENVKLIIAIGQEQNAIFNHYSSTNRVIKSNTLEDAVKIALENANKDSIVLFSPACKSFDMFMNFEHRGEVFKNAVNSLV